MFCISDIPHHTSMALHGNAIVKATWKERFWRYLSSAYEKQQTHKVSIFIQQRLSESSNADKVQLLQLADSFISKYGNSLLTKEIAESLDRTCSAYRIDRVFRCQKNKDSFDKWTKYGFSPEIYQLHPEFCSFMESSGLLSQIKVTRDRPIMIDNEPAILVEGHHTKWSELQDRFNLSYSKVFGEKFIVDSEINVYTYLDNGKGLQKHHPFLTDVTPISVINRQEYEQVLQKAREFVREGEETLSQQKRDHLIQLRTFVIQIVSSYHKHPDTNWHEILIKPMHPYLRLIIGKDNPEANTKRGEVYEIGFVLKNPVILPFATIQGCFRSPDKWEYKGCEERVVTNIPITQVEARAFTQFSRYYHNQDRNLGNEVGFHFTKQNCTTFTQKALGSVGISIPTEITLPKLIGRIAPNWIKAVAQFFVRLQEKISRSIGFVGSVIPKSVKSALYYVTKRISNLFHQFSEVVLALTLLTAKVALGEASGSGGLALNVNIDSHQKVERAITNPKSWFSLSAHHFNLPGILQEWQRKQASTVIYKKPLLLSIIP